MKSAISRRKRFTTIGITAAVLVAGGGGVAVAFFSASGSDSSWMATGSSTNFTVATGPGTGVALTPGGAANTVPFTVSNAGTGNQMLRSVAVTVANADGTPWVAVAGCSDVDYQVSQPTITYGDLAAGKSATGSVVVTMRNLPTSQDACQNVIVPLYINAS